MKAHATATICLLLVASGRLAGAASAPPVVTLTPGEAVFRPGKGPIAVDPGVSIADPDSPTGIVRATVRITDPIDAPQEILAAPSPGSLTATYDAAQGLLTLSGTASPEDYTDALQSVTYNNVKTTPTKTPARLIEFQAQDLDGNLSAVTTRSLQIASLMNYYTFNGNYNDGAGTRNLYVAMAGTGGGSQPQLVAGPVADGITTRTNVVHVPGGATNFYYLSNTTGTMQTHFTAMLWANSDTKNPGANKGIYSNGPNQTTYFQFDNNSGTYSHNGGATGRLNYKAVVAKRWTHLCVTWDGAVTNLYADGVLVNSKAANAGDTFSRMNIGVNRGLNNGFAGYVDDVGIFSYAFDDKRIASTYALGRFHERNLDSADIDLFVSTFNAGPGSSLNLDGTTWMYAPAAILDAGTTVGTSGGSLAGKNAYVVLDHSGNGMRVAEPPGFVPVSGVGLAVGQTHPNVTLGLAVDPNGSAMTVSIGNSSALVIGNARVWESGTVTADVDATGLGVTVGLSVPVVVTVSNGLMSTSGTVTISITTVPNAPPVFLTTGTVTGGVGKTTLAPGIATIQDDVAVTSVSVAYAPPGVTAAVSAITPTAPKTVSVDLNVSIALLVASGTYPIRLMAYDTSGATIGTVALNATAEPTTTPPTGDAQQILQATSVTGGLIVHLGCGDGKLTAALGSNSKCIVQGLDTNPANVDQARQHIDSAGIYGRVTAEPWSGAALPYIDNTINLIVAEELSGIDIDELMRALIPNGIAYLKYGDTWSKYVKPRPEWIDEWTHYMHDASNNMVARDEAVQFPKRLQWVADPAWSRHHDHKSAVNGCVSANGRIFSFIDEGARQSIFLPDRLALVAQDAFNGAELWRRTFDKWHNRLWPLKSGPFQLTRRLVAVGDKVYATLGTDAPATCLDAATGDIVQTYDYSRTAEELIYYDGVLYMQVNDSPSSYTYNTIAEIKTAADTTWWNGEPRWITAINADTGALLWRKQLPIAPASLAVSDRGVFYYDGQRVIRLDKTNGSQIWQSTDVLPRKTNILSEDGVRVVLYENMVLFAGNDGSGGGTMYGLSADDGHTSWSASHPPTGHHSPLDLLVADGLVWTGAIANSANSGVFTGRDPWTGDVIRTFAPDTSIYFMHHRCYMAKATDNYFLASRTGIEFIDLRSYHWTTHHWVRGACIYGIMPCNGLIYAPPHPCACYMESKLNGFVALAPDNSGTTINRGPNAVANADFESGDNPWQFLPDGSGNALRHQTENNGYVALIRVTGDAQTGHIRQSLPTVDGTRYYVSFDLPYWGQQPNLTGQFLVDLGGAVLELAAANGRVEGAITAGNGGYLDIKPAGNLGEIAMVDNVNVRKMATLTEDTGTPAPLRAQAQTTRPAALRLVRGPAHEDRSYGSYKSYGSNQLAPSPDQGDWPTYRHDTARSGCASTSVSNDLRLAWRRTIGGQLTALTVAGGKVLVAAVETHTVYALDVADGHIVWKYMAGGRVDSPPTIDGDKVYFGCHDGWVYCLSAGDGQLAWRYRAAPEDRRLVAHGQVESVWPVNGSVLVTEGSVYCVAGRSMFIDGGLHFLRLDAQTGQLQLEKVLDNRDPVSGQNLQVYVSGQNMVVALPDILSYDGNYIYMRSSPMDKDGVRQYLAYTAHPVTDQVGPYTHLFASTSGGFLDDSWFHRTDWVYGQSTAQGWGGWYLAGQNAPSGRILAFTSSAVFGFGRKPQYYNNTTPLEYRIFRAPLPRTIVTGPPKTFATDWVTTPTILGRAMALTSNTIFLAGPRDVLDEEEAINNLNNTVIQSEMLAQEAALAGQSGAQLVAVSTADGAVQSQLNLSDPPVFDGMAAAYGNLFMSTLSGDVICLKPPVVSSLVKTWTMY